MARNRQKGEHTYLGYWRGYDASRWLVVDICIDLVAGTKEAGKRCDDAKPDLGWTNL